MESLGKSISFISGKLSHLFGNSSELLSSVAAQPWVPGALIVAKEAAFGLAVSFFSPIVVPFLWNGLLSSLGAAGILRIMRAPGTAGLLIPRTLFSLSPKVYFAVVRTATKLAASRLFGLVVPAGVAARALERRGFGRRPAA